ncbi:SNARE-like domain protein [Bacteriovorax sp. BAL6_X]|uniref:DedA family protein n=1 Tax=Bacteriovorax sp. BAL6_X TaxID=1201290 RepID=UPI000385BFCE|nr:DedA family protein [Bacteriovorax sp. BAL6_X]EPZ52076.1 SNARE-like domain protein [Bacteriovorax sp. BAL6_X]
MEFIDQIMLYINTHVHMAPFIIFGLLLLAGFNIPISEDLMLFTSAILAAKNPEYLYPLFIGVFLGAYLSDLICYGFIGRYLGPKIFGIKFFASMVTPERLDTVNAFFKKYGVFTLIFGRFVPFGFRNALFLSAGLGRMNAWKFALSDLLAASISCVVYFTVYYKFGETAIEYIKKSNYVIGAVALAVILGVIVSKWKKRDVNV